MLKYDIYQRDADPYTVAQGQPSHGRMTRISSLEGILTHDLLFTQQLPGIRFGK